MKIMNKITKIIPRNSSKLVRERERERDFSIQIFSASIKYFMKFATLSFLKTIIFILKYAENQFKVQFLLRIHFQSTDAYFDNQYYCVLSNKTILNSIKCKHKYAQYNELMSYVIRKDIAMCRNHIYIYNKTATKTKRNNGNHEMLTIILACTCNLNISFQASVSCSKATEIHANCGKSCYEIGNMLTIAKNQQI